MFEILVQDTLTAFPYIGWALLAILILTVQIVTGNVRLCLVAAIAGLVGLLIFGAVTFDNGIYVELFSGSVVMDPMSQVFNLIGLGTVLAVLLTMLPGLKSPVKLFQTSYQQLPEMLVCLLLSGFGLSVLVSAVDLTALFLGLETLSIALYCLCGFYRTEIQSTESALKYLLIGAFSTVLFLYGIAFIYGAAGSTNYAQIFQALKGQTGNVLLHIGTLFMVAGIAFKLAFVPFHLYTADVYEGAPTPITGYLATIIKIGVLGAGLRIFWGLLGSVVDQWQPVWLALCVLSIFVGNVVALQQRTLKRLLAFSSISHAGFMGLGLIVAHPEKGSAFPLIAYLLVYTSMTIGTFALLTYAENRERPFLVEDLKGIGQRRFLFSLVFSIFVLSLAGLPPFAGFMIKFWILQSLLEMKLTTFAVLAVIGSLIGAAYYLKLLMYMFMSTEEGGAVQWKPVKDSYVSIRFVVFLAAAITVLGGIRPQFYADWILSSLALK